MHILIRSCCYLWTNNWGSILKSLWELKKKWSRGKFVQEYIKLRKLKVEFNDYNLKSI